MRLPIVIRSLASGLCVYVLASACAATDGQSSADDAGARSVADALADVVGEISNPVHDAKADPAGPDVAVESCTTPLKRPDGSESYFAIHSYPGKTRIDLASLHVSILRSDGPDGYSDAQVSAWIRDGSAAVPCGFVASAALKVTFVLPAK